MSTFDTLFPIPAGGRNADDMGLPPVLPATWTNPNLTDAQRVDLAELRRKVNELLAAGPEL